VLTTIAEKGTTLRPALLKTLIGRGRVVVPTAVIAESTTGDHRRDANVNRALKKLSVVDLDAALAKSAAALRHARNRSGAGTIDAIVVATADAVPGTAVLTSDPDDLRALASVRGRTRIVALSEMV
jgi:predicted nucleic acid-binding protein